MTLIEKPTDERINIEKLKIPEQISFFEEICLFEDELSDHGISSLVVKIRVMPSSFYILQRFFLRVDDVVIRVYDTRIYHESSNNYLIREYTEKESLVKDLNWSEMFSLLIRFVLKRFNNLCKGFKLPFALKI